MLGEGVHPEVVFQYGVWLVFSMVSSIFYYAHYYGWLTGWLVTMKLEHIVLHTSHGNMSRDTLVIPFLPEEAESRGHVLLHPLALVVRVSKGREAR